MEEREAAETQACEDRCVSVGWAGVRELQNTGPYFTPIFVLFFGLRAVQHIERVCARVKFVDSSAGV